MAKTVNYTPEMTATLVERYTSVRESDEATRDAMVSQLAAEFKKTERSIRAKLSREQVYVAKTPVSSTTGKPAAKKIEMATNLVNLMNINVDAEDVAKMTKVSIDRITDAFVALSTEASEPSAEIVEDENAS